MKTKLKDYLQNYPSGVSWKGILIFIITFQINSYFIINWLIPLPFLEEISNSTYGLLRPALLAFILSVLFYPIVFHLSRGSNIKYSFASNKLASLIIIITLLITFTFIFIPFYNYENRKSIGYFFELLSGAIFEELIFRFFLLGGMIQILRKPIRKKSIWMAIIITSLIFSLGHLFYHIKHDMVYIKFYIMATIIGVLLSWIYIWFNNLILVIFLHLSFNLINLFLPLDDAGKGIGILIWFLIMIILAVKGKDIKKIKLLRI